MTIAKVTQRLRRFARLAKEDGLINTSDLLVATAATVVLASAVGGAAISVLNESKYGKAQPDAQTISQAITAFYKDTGKWPGQAEQATDTAKAVLLATDTTATALPSVASNGLKSTDQTACKANSLDGFVSGAVAGFGSATTSTPIEESDGLQILNLNDYLVRKPATGYSNWKGPYLQQEITGDPWGRSWIAYLAPLYCSEAVSTGAGNLGYGWVISGGLNGTVTTDARDANLDPDGDDSGISLGKLSTAGS